MSFIAARVIYNKGAIPLPSLKVDLEKRANTCICQILVTENLTTDKKAVFSVPGLTHL